MEIGSFGEVKKVKHKVSHQIRVVKVINKEDYEESDNLVDEIEVLKGLVNY